MSGGRLTVTDHFDVFLSYSRNDLDAAALLRTQLERAGLGVFKDDKSIREGDLWLDKLQAAVDGCGAFVVLVGRDGVRRWIGAETQAALGRHFGPHADAERLPIFPILLGDTRPETLPAFLRLFQATRWPGDTPLPDTLIESIRCKRILADTAASFEGCPFVGLDAFRIDQANLFFGRQKETLEALACFDRRPGAPTVRWLEIFGNSGSGKSSLMCAGILPLVDQGWLWPRTGFEHWRPIGPLMPGAPPVEMLAESLHPAFGGGTGERYHALQADDRALAWMLRDNRPDDDTAFLLAVDQFEELFTFADADERQRFDRLLAAALDDADCPLFVISTVRADFLDRFDDLPRLAAVQNRVGRSWKLPPIGAEGLREIIDGPARLAGLDVDEVREIMVREAEDEPGALPLVENALFWLWEKRTDGRLSGRLLSEQGGIAGILSRCADDLLAGLDARSRDRALDLLFRMVLIDPEGRRHTRRRMPLAEAIAIAGGGERGHELVDRLAGRRLPGGVARHGPLRLITVTEDAGDGAPAARQDRWVNLIHETLIRSKGVDATGTPQPYWPTLWDYIERNKERAARRERLQLMAREWKDRWGLSRLAGLAGWSALFGFRGLAAPGSLERRYLSWSRGRAVVEIAVLTAVAGVVGESVAWAMRIGAPIEAVMDRWAYTVHIATPPLPGLVEIPAGSFRVGSERDAWSKPVHRVTFAQPFQFGRTEVTFQEWDACVADGGCGYRPADQGWGRDTRPVINVSWDDAQVYVAWLGRRMRQACRLPSEAEWEYAARADTTTEFALPAPGGSDDVGGQGLANCQDCGSEWDFKQTAPVASFPPNAWGLHDMHGNVVEWVEDCVHGTYDGAPDDGRAWLDQDGGDCSSRVLRGGSWSLSQVLARAAFRFWFGPDLRSFDLGFRVVCSSPSSGH